MWGRGSRVHPAPSRPPGSAVSGRGSGTDGSCWSPQTPRGELPTRSPLDAPTCLSGSPAAAGPANPPLGPVKSCSLRVHGQGFSTERWVVGSPEQRLGPRPSQEKRRPAPCPPHLPLCSPCCAPSYDGFWKGTGPCTSHQAGGRESLCGCAGWRPLKGQLSGGMKQARKCPVECTPKAQ